MSYIDFIDSLIKCINKHGALDYFNWDMQTLSMWDDLSDNDKWYIVEESNFTGCIIPDEYLQFTTLLKQESKDHFLGRYTTMRDCFGDDNFPYIIKYEDGTIIDTPELLPEQKIKTSGVLWILGGAGLCEDTYYAKNKYAEDDLIIYAGATFWKNGVQVK